MKVEDDDKVLLTVIDSFGNQILGVYPVVVDKTAPTVTARHGDETLTESTLIQDDKPLDISANDRHVRRLKVELRDIAGRRSPQIACSRMWMLLNVG